MPTILNYDDEFDFEDDYYDENNFDYEFEEESRGFEDPHRMNGAKRDDVSWATKARDKAAALA